jgi:DNA polymerase
VPAISKTKSRAKNFAGDRTASAPSKNSAAPTLPIAKSIAQARAGAQNCEACDLYKHATQTVFGEGARKPRILFVGEQPGDQEDKQGKPFVGPAGKLLDTALESGELVISNERRSAGAT